MSATIELDEERQRALEQVARGRKVSLRRALEKAVDEFIERAEDEELLESSARVARRTGLRERDAVKIVREWRNRRDAGRG
jgi:predicted transcriptional regulator